MLTQNNRHVNTDFIWFFQKHFKTYLTVEEMFFEFELMHIYILYVRFGSTDCF
jgi:hypothetical protein